MSKTLETEKDAKKMYKIILIGDGGVGKTSIKRAYLGLEYIDKYNMTLGVEYSIKSPAVIWDIGGQEGYGSTVEEYFDGAQAAVLVFDITDRKTFDRLERWLNLLQMRVGYGIPVIIAGNKADQREFGYDDVSIDEAIERSQYFTRNSIFEIPYVETSALTGLNVNYVFEYLITTLITMDS